MPDERFGFIPYILELGGSITQLENEQLFYNILTSESSIGHCL